METVNNDLVFNVAQLMKEPVGSTRKLELSTPELLLSTEQGDMVNLTSLEAYNVTGVVKATRLSKDILVQGDVEADVLLECSRCLEQFRLPVKGELEENYQQQVEVETGRPVQRAPYEEDDTAFTISLNHEMDLTEPVRQALIVALPLKPLHDEDCKGLCSQCGANLNEGPCDCVPDTEDNRWAALKALNLEDLPPGDPNLN